VFWIVPSNITYFISSTNVLFYPFRDVPLFSSALESPLWEEAQWGPSVGCLHCHVLGYTAPPPLPPAHRHLPRLGPHALRRPSPRLHFRTTPPHPIFSPAVWRIVVAHEGEEERGLSSRGGGGGRELTQNRWQIGTRDLAYWTTLRLNGGPSRLPFKCSAPSGALHTSSSLSEVTAHHNGTGMFCRDPDPSPGLGTLRFLPASPP